MNNAHRVAAARRIYRRRRTAATCITFVAAAVPTAVAASRLLDSGVIGDYAAHLRYAQRFAETLEPPIGHFLFTALAAVLGEILDNYELAAVLIVTTAQGALAVLVGAWIRRRMRAASTDGAPPWARRLWIPSVAGVLLVLAGPASLVLADAQRGHYLGYVALVAYHNPTQLLLRPFAMVVFVAVVTILDRPADEPARRGGLIALGVAVTLMTVTKPSYTLCIVPAAFLVAWLDRGPARARTLRMLVVGLALPAAAALIVTFVITYVTGVEGFESQSGGIVLAPFDTYSFFSGQLALKFALSVAFPVAVLFAYPNALRRDVALRVAWAAFAFGAAATYLLAESGERRYQGNFWWSGQVTLFLLFVASAAHVVVREALAGRSESRWRPSVPAAACLAVFVVHLVSGFEFLLTNVFDPSAVIS